MDSFGFGHGGDHSTIVVNRKSTLVARGFCNLGCMPRVREKPLEGFARRLQLARERLDPPISRGQIMARCGVSSAALYKWETNAEPAIKPGNLFQLADLLNVRHRWLATAMEPMEIDPPSEALRIAEDWAVLPVEYRAAIRKHTDDLLAAIALMPGLRMPLDDERVGTFIKPAPKPAPARKFTADAQFHHDGDSDPSKKLRLASKCTSKKS